MFRKSVERIIAVLLLCLLMPFGLIVACCVWIELGKPILFRQTRIGQFGFPFVFLKFRTMTCERDSEGALLPDAHRLNAFGRFLRAFSLDELPQLINVVRGEMSLIGPRPLLAEYLPRYNAHQLRRHDVKPGITGWAQVNGRNGITWAEKLDLDIWYVDHRSFGLDVRILLRTLKTVIRPQGINADGHATAPVFMGSVEPEQNKR